jgi:CheY-like chemotaxis protein
MTTASRKPVILVAEDEADVRKLLNRVLVAVGDVVEAADGQDAWEQLEAGLTPDLIVTDLMMPRMDGVALVGKLKNHPQLSRVPVVMLTAKSGPRDIVVGINAGARHYLTKPFKTEELLAKVRRALGK